MDRRAKSLERKRRRREQKVKVKLEQRRKQIVRLRELQRREQEISEQIDKEARELGKLVKPSVMKVETHAVFEKQRWTQQAQVKEQSTGFKKQAWQKAGMTSELGER
jgi:hypothetical protein